MKYNEFKAPTGKVLFNLDNFTYGNTILSAFDLNLIVLDKEEAEQLANEYIEKQEEIRQQETINTDNENDEVQSSPAKARRMNVATMNLNEDGEYEEVADEPKDELIEFKQQHIANLIARGILLDKTNVICNIKNTQYI